MGISISDRGRSMLALCEAREELRRESEKLNEETRRLIVENSNNQKDLLAKMAEIDKAVAAIAQYA